MQANPHTMLRRCEIAGLFLCAPLLFSSNILIARLLQGTLPPVTLAFGRWLVAALLLTPFIWSSLRNLRPIHMAQLILPAILGGALSVAPLYAAAAITAIGHVGLVMAATPLIVAVLERLFWAVPLRGVTLIGIGLAVVGIAVTTFEGSPARLLELTVNHGDLLALAASLAWAGYTALLRHRRVDLPPALFLWGVGAGGAMVLLPFAGMEWAILGTPSFGPEAVAGVLALAVIAGIGAYLSYNRVVALVGPSTASLAMYLVPVYALGLGALVLGEELRLYHAVAVALILGGVVVATCKVGKRALSVSDHGPMGAAGRPVLRSRRVGSGGRVVGPQPALVLARPATAKFARQQSGYTLDRRRHQG